MIVPINWLKEYIDLKHSDEEIADILTFGGTNIDSLEKGVMDAEVTANRPDTLSIYGMARELAALTKTILKPLEIKEVEIGESQKIRVQLLGDDLVYRYTGCLIEGITLKESPDWLKEKIESVGIRPINNIVDVTNYIMFLTGQPLHAFDADKIRGGEIIVRRAQKGEMVRTLDSIDRQLDQNAIVIENNGQLIDLAGIMGGELSEISEETQNIFLQSAVFNPVLIRRTSKYTKLVTEASYRYERGVDIENSLGYLKKAIELILELSGGKAEQLVDIYRSPLNPYAIEWSVEKGEKLLGIAIDQNTAIQNLARLGIETKCESGVCRSTIPSWRVDLCLPEDIFEEIVRFFPVNNLPRTYLPPQAIDNSDTNYAFKEYIKDQLVNLGLTEIIGYSFLSQKEVIRTGFAVKDCIKVTNPLSEEYEYLRSSLLPGLLTAVFRNPAYDPIALFELGRVFSPAGEEERLGIMIAGRGAQHVESVFKTLLERLNAETEFEVRDIPQEILNSFKIRKSTVRFLEISISQLRNKAKIGKISYLIPKMDQIYQPIAKFPSVRRDIAIIVDKGIDHGLIKQSIYQTDPHIRNVELFDVFESERFGKDKVSLAYRITYQSDEKTLSNDEVNSIHSQVLQNLEAEYKVKLR